MKIEICDTLKKTFEDISEFLGKFSQLSDEEVKRKNNDAIRMIDYYTGMTNAIEDRRNKIYENSLVIIGISVAAATIVGTLISSWKDFLFIPLSFFLVQFIFQIILILTFYFQNNTNYIFNINELADCSNQWKWFYRGNHIIRKINTKKLTIESAESYVSGLSYFLGKYLVEDARLEISSNLEQLYLLQVHNYYKNTFYLKLARIQRLSIIISISITLLVSLLIVILPLLTAE